MDFDGEQEMQELQENLDRMDGQDALENFDDEAAGGAESLANARAQVEDA